LPETGASESSGEADVESLERHYRVTLDFRLLVRAIKSEYCRRTSFITPTALLEALTGVRHVGPDCLDASVWLPFVVELVGETSLQKL